MGSKKEGRGPGMLVSPLYSIGILNASQSTERNKKVISDEKQSKEHNLKMMNFQN